MKEYTQILLKCLLIIMSTISICPSSYAAYLTNVPQHITQPDGRILECFATGDEYFNYLHDQNGFIIIKNDQTGYYVYADIENDQLAFTDLNPMETDAERATLPSAEEILRILDVKEIIVAKKNAAQMPLFDQSTDYYSPPPHNAPLTGLLNNIVIFIRFSDQSEYDENIYEFDDMFNGTGNSMRQYYLSASYNSLDISSHYFPSTMTTVVSYQDEHPRDYYVNYGDERTLREHTLLKNALEYFESEIPSNIDFDGDNDGYVDNVCFIIQGYPEGWSELLWPHKWTLYSYDVSINGSLVYPYTFQLHETINPAVLCHEMFHTLGAPDLYHYDTEYSYLKPIGNWGLMAESTSPQAHMGAYMKFRYGQWIEEIPLITVSGNYNLSPLSSPTNNCYKILSPYSSTEFFILEYRNTSSDYFESGLPGSGLLVYRINSEYIGNVNGPPDEVYLYRPEGNPVLNGYPNSAHFSSDVGRTVIDDGTDPSSFLTDGSAGGLQISQIGVAGELISFHVDIVPAPQISAIERTALIAFYNNNGGNNWQDNTGWKTPPLDTDGFAEPGTEGSWYGVTIENGHVIELNLSGSSDASFGLTNSIPTEIGDLAYLNVLDLSYNELSGDIPLEIYSLSYLSVLDLSHNTITGSISSSISNLNNLHYLSYAYNQLSNSIPDELGSLTNLETLYIAQNQLSGSIPTSIGNLVNLRYLNFASNLLNGEIPTVIGNLINLRLLYLYANELSGEIPSTIGDLTYLIHLYLSQNNLSGNIPVDLFNLSNLEILHLSTNNLFGTIPNEIGFLVNLEILSLSNNQLSGSVPETIGNLTDLQSLFLYSNSLSGNLPSSITNFGNMSEDGLECVLIDTVEMSHQILIPEYDITYSDEIIWYESDSSDSGPQNALQSMSTLWIQNNYFTFSNLASSGIFPGNISSFNYAPQYNLSAPMMTASGSGILLSIPPGHANNQYQWYCDGIVVSGGTSNELTLPIGTTGEYKCSVTNSLYPELTLWTDVLAVTHTCPFTPVADTGVYSPIVIQDIVIFDTPPEAGDWIGVFDGELCVGAIEYTGSFPMTMSAIMEFSPPVGDPLPGAQVGLPIIYQLWDASADATLQAKATYAVGSGVFGETLTVVTLLESYQEQAIELASGKVNMISLNVTPEQATAESVFADIPSLVIAQDDEGRFYIPPYSVNTIGGVLVSKGYKVYHSADDPDTLTLRGLPVDPESVSYSFSNTKLYLIDNPYRSSLPVTDVFNTITSHVVVVQDDRGTFWIPQYGVNTLGNLTPGRGYQIYVDTACDFTYPPEPTASASLAAKEVPVLNQPEHFIFTQTGLPHAVIIEESDVILSPGDEIAVYEGELCVGATVFTGNYPVAIPAWQGMEEYELPGYTPGHDIGLRLWRDNERSEVILQSDITVFDGEPISVVSITGTGELTVTNTAAPLAYALHQNSPNPFNPVTTINYSLPQDDVVTMRIFDVTGRMVRTLVNQDMPAGTHAVRWDATDANGQSVSNGIYFVRLNAGYYQQTIKVMLLK